MEPIPAFQNSDFINSSQGRMTRILAEFYSIEHSLHNSDVQNTTVFFGSARTKPDNKYYKAAEELSSKITKLAQVKNINMAVSTGGGPGIMEAANKGCYESGGKSIGLGINLPFEQKNNSFITQGLNFKVHYFFIRKVCLTYNARAFVVFPGGIGTMDELFEILTLIQTMKKNPIPVFLYGKDFWTKAFNFDILVQEGYICPKDLDLFTITDDFDLISNNIFENVA